MNLQRGMRDTAYNSLLPTLDYLELISQKWEESRSPASQGCGVLPRKRGTTDLRGSVGREESAQRAAAQCEQLRGYGNCISGGLVGWIGSLIPRCEPPERAVAVSVLVVPRTRARVRRPTISHGSALIRGSNLLKREPGSRRRSEPGS